MNDSYRALRASRIITLTGEVASRSLKELDSIPVSIVDGILVIQGGVVIAVEPYGTFRRGAFRNCQVEDLGQICLAPGLINAHCHLELSHLVGKTRSGQGFAAWMQSLVPLASTPVRHDELKERLFTEFQRMAQLGIVHVGDVGSRNPSLVAEVASAVATRLDTPYPVTHFLETFGYARNGSMGELPSFLYAGGFAPEASAAMPKESYEHCAIAGHALYSTAPEGLVAAYQWCNQNKRSFSMHLAESEDETQCLRDGQGPLCDMLKRRVLPTEWKAPGQSAVNYADKLGLLGRHTIAVHCVQCDGQDAVLLGMRGASVCLCPRSNSYIGVGTAPARSLADAGVSLCLGTDSLASNHDLDVAEEMRFAQSAYGLSPQACLRMATVNGAHALGLKDLGSIEPGKAACFSFWDEKEL